ncbi:FapA family protein, partial [bacterium]|nr:FapA family protein [bacterium]
ADDGEDEFISAGTNTYFANDGDTELRASIIGSVTLEGGIVNVENILILNKGVNFATGNINYPGDVIITGDVGSGFSVKAEGKVEIRGVVSDAIIEAEGDVLVIGGFIGSGKGKITSRHDVFVKFIDNQQVEAEGCVHIGNHCVQATITAGGLIEVNTGSGTVIGGRLSARDGILAKNLGNQQNTKTIVEITGDAVQYAEELQHKENEIQDVKTKITEITSFVSKLKRENMQSKISEPKTVERIQRYQDLAQDLSQKVEKLEEDMKIWAEDGGCKGDIQVSSKVYPGTVIIMGNVSICVETETGKALFKRSGEEIIDMNAPKAIEQQPEPVE